MVENVLNSFLHFSILSEQSISATCIQFQWEFFSEWNELFLGSLFISSCYTWAVTFGNQQKLPSVVFKSFQKSQKIGPTSTPLVFVYQLPPLLMSNWSNVKVMIQWRIQDFPEGAPTAEGLPTYYLTIFYENCMKMRNFWPGVRPSLAP